MDYSERNIDNGNSSRYRDRSYDDENDIEQEDSDTESTTNNGSNSGRKYKDNDSIGSPKQSRFQGKKVNININTSIAKSPVKTTKPVKKVDLGAAKNFGESDIKGDTTTKYESNSLNDDFNPRASEGKESVLVAEFGDFETAFGTNQEKKNEDDFADFNSAFNSGNTQPYDASHSHNKNQYNLISSTQPISQTSALGNTNSSKKFNFIHLFNIICFRK